MVIKMGRFGRFMACSSFPECRNTRPVPSEANGAQEASSESNAQEATDEVCDKCGKPMLIRTGRFGKFIACSDYPECKTSKPILNKVGVPCPRCGGDLVQRRSRGKGRVFYGCSRYPDCDFLVNQRPLPEPCPECGGLMVQSGREGARCTACAWKGDASAPEEALARH
jgi:DNA topoisomerase-1